MLTSLKTSTLLRVSSKHQYLLRPYRNNLKSNLRVRPISMSAEGTEKLDKSTSDDVWKKLLTAEEYHVLRQKGTEPPGTGKYDKFFEEGEYVCAGCKTPLYTSEQKFNSGCGWPAFYDNKEGAVERFTDTSLGMQRTEIVCQNCGAHLGHVFKGEGFPTPTNERHCVNSVSLKFNPKSS
eukprot:TRINITY_DN2039_c0_g1_i1.p3 TRINITY_DN2039_c0_g1~~TRINITY_DN2039_c0_g1_i1.p3  ORF type:complete len:179 (+),score=21.58 TRINITY_DN2039_c0_g1_i1:68-604(+)